MRPSSFYFVTSIVSFVLLAVSLWNGQINTALAMALCGIYTGIKSDLRLMIEYFNEVDDGYN